MPRLGSGSRGISAECYYTPRRKLRGHRIDGVEIGLSRQGPSHAADGVFDAAFLPGAMGVAEEGLDAKTGVEAMMFGELGSVVEGDGAAKFRRQGLEPGQQLAGRGIGGLAGVAGEEKEAGGALAGDQEGLSGRREEHEIGFPVAGDATMLNRLGALNDGNTMLDEGDRRSVRPAPPTPLELGLGKIQTPCAVVGAPDLGVDEAVDALVADDMAAILAGQPAGHLLGRPPQGQAMEHEIAQLAVALQTRTRPASSLRLLVGITRFVADLLATIALQLARDRRCRAIHSCSDLPERLPVFMKTGNRAALFQREMLIMSSHANTFDRCCTSFVKSGGSLAEDEQGSPSLRSG